MCTLTECECTADGIHGNHPDVAEAGAGSGSGMRQSQYFVFVCHGGTAHRSSGAVQSLRGLRQAVVPVFSTHSHLYRFIMQARWLIPPAIALATIYRDDITYAGTATKRITTACGAAAYAALRYKIYNDTESVHQMNAELMYKVAASHAGLYSKAGQYAATLQILPKQYTTALAQLMDNAGSEPWRIAVRTLQAELGSGFDQFAWIEQTPVAAASLAQVHRAVTADGRRVAVKVQKSTVARDSKVDMATFRLLLAVLAELFPERDFRFFLPEFEKVLRVETDFVQEGIQSRRAAVLSASCGSSSVKAHVAIPDVAWEFTKSRVLCTSWVNGVHANDLAALRALGVLPASVAEVAVRFFAEQTFVAGLLHLDPHVGNVLVSVPDAVMQRLQPAVREALFPAWPAEAEAAAAAPGPNPRALAAPPLDPAQLFSSVLDGLELGAISLACLPVLAVLGVGAGIAVGAARAMRAMGWHVPIRELSRDRHRMSDEVVKADDSKSGALASEQPSRHAQSAEPEPAARLASEMGVDDSTAARQGRAAQRSAVVRQAQALPVHDQWQLQVIDHGMYRRLEPHTRAAYAALWYSILTGDGAAAADAVEQLGLPASDRKRYAELLSLVLLFRPTGTGGGTGGALTAQQRRDLHQRFQPGGDLHIGSEEVSEFVQRLPQDVWISLRNSNIVRGLNKDLGGTTASRSLAMIEAAIRGSRVPVAAQHPPVLPCMIDVPEWVLDPARAVQDARRLNLQVDAEVDPQAANAAQLTWVEWAGLKIAKLALRFLPRQPERGQGREWG